jgi:hypothetical protein
MVETDALPTPETSQEVTMDDEKVKLTRDQLHEFNKKAVEYYRQYVMEYLKDAKAVKAGQEIDEETKDTYFNGYIKKDWTDAKAKAQLDMGDKLNPQKK